MGATGATGIGATGATGIGATGATGGIGATGATGIGATGATGIGATGATGAIGATGATGAQGNFGGYPYLWSTGTTAADPLNDHVAFNNSTYSSVTHVYINKIDAQGNDIGAVIATWVSGTQLLFADSSGAGNRYATFTVNGAQVDHTTWIDIPVSYVSSFSTFTGDDLLFISPAFAGATGATGATGVGATGATGVGATGATGVGATGATGASNALGQTEVDFGSTPTMAKVFTVDDGNITPGMYIVAVQSGDAPTGKSQDDNELDIIDVAATAGSGTVTLDCRSRFGPVVGKFKINYSGGQYSTVGATGASGAVGATGATGTGGDVTRLFDSVLGATAASFDITSISGSYKHLKLVCSLRANNSSDQAVHITFNNDSGTNYMYLRHYRDTSTADAWGASANDTFLYLCDAPGSARTAGNCVAFEMTIADYAGTTFRKGVCCPMSTAFTNVGVQTAANGMWLSTAAINRITISLAAGNLEIGSRVTLYGMN
jgi:hypothetical protein